ncbi:trans-sialidase, putative, partial [Trypanosoma cruzi]
SLGVVLRRTTITKGNGVFPPAGGSDVSCEGVCWREDGLEPKLVVGDVTNPTGGKRSGRIECGHPKPLPKLISSAFHEGDWTEFIASGGAGVVMKDGTLVFPLMAKDEAEDVCSMIISSTDGGSIWTLSEDISPAECLNPASPSGRDRFTWLLTARAARGCRSRVTWGQRGRRPSGHSQPCGSTHDRESRRRKACMWMPSSPRPLREGRRVMLCTQRGHASGKKKATALCLWVTDSNRTFSVGPAAVDSAADWMLASTLLHSDGCLHFLQRRGNCEGRVISLSRLTEEMNKIKSVLSTWEQKDILFSRVS